MLAQDQPLKTPPRLRRARKDRPRLVSLRLDDRAVETVLHRTGSRLRLRLHPAIDVQQRLQQHLAGLPEVRTVRLNPLASCCVVEFAAAEQAPQDDAALRLWIQSLPGCAALRAAGCEPQASAPYGDGEQEDGEEGFVPSRLVLPISSLALALLSGPLALPPLAVAGFILVSAHLSFNRAWSGLRDERKINVDFLDALAVTLHSLEGFLVGPALMISMIEGGEAVRDATQRLAHATNTDLLASLQADVRRLRSDGCEEVVRSADLVAGDRVLFFPGESIPIDGVVESGEGSFDVVKLTGESVPRHATAGDEVLAGFMLLEGSLIVKTTAVGSGTRIGQITAMIEAAPVYDTRVGNVAARIANRFVLPTLALAGVSLLFSAGNIAQAASLLMFDLGTGLRVSVPTAIMAALTRASSQGLLIRSGRALEQLVDIDVVVFDKTGTLTLGHPSVVQVQVLQPDLDERHLTWLATTAEQGLNHPIATAIVRHAQEQGVPPGACDAWDYRIGKGVCAVIGGQRVLIGNARILMDESLAIPELHPDQSLLASTPVYLAVDGVVAAVFYAADELRPDSRALVAELHRRGIQAHMLTGDMANVAHAVAAQLGLEPQEVHAECLPDQKADLVRQLAAEGHKVAFVGDGINDSAALAYADVSVSFASGSDLARETADIVLTNDKVSGFLVAQDLARRTFELVRQNIGIVGVPNLSALVIGTVVPVSPITAVLLNNGSCLVAAANAMRTLRFRATPLPAVSATSTGAAAPSATSTSEPPPALSAKALAERMGTTYQKIFARVRRGDLADWSHHLDPEGCRWSHCPTSNTFHPMSA